MQLATKSFIITRGGGGINDVTVFIASEIGRELSLIKSINASSLNDQATLLTLEYYVNFDSYVDISSPINGLITTPDTIPEFYTFCFNNRIPFSSFSGKVFQNNTGLTNFLPYVSGDYDNGYLVKIKSNPTGSYSGNLITHISNELPNIFGHPQQYHSTQGLTLVHQASPYIGDQNLYTQRFLRGEAQCRYLLLSKHEIDFFLKPILSEASSGGTLISYTTCQKGNNYTEIFVLVLTKSEAIPIDVYPRAGAMNVDVNSHLSEINISFNVPIASTIAPFIYVSRNYTDIVNIPNEYLDHIDDRTIAIDFARFYADYAFTGHYIDLVIGTGIKADLSAGGLSSTRPYLIPYSLYVSNVAVGTGLSGITGPQGPAGPAGPAGSSSGFSGLAPYADNLILRWDGNSGTGIQGSQAQIDDFGNIIAGGGLLASGSQMNLNYSGSSVGTISFGNDQILRVAVSGQTTLKCTSQITLQSGNTNRLRMDASDGTWYPTTTLAASLGKTSNYWNNLYVKDATFSNSIVFNGNDLNRSTYGSSFPTPIRSGDLTYRNDIGETFVWTPMYTGWTSLNSNSYFVHADGGGAAYSDYGYFNNLKMNTDFGIRTPYDIILTNIHFYLETNPGNDVSVELRVDGGSVQTITSPTMISFQEPLSLIVNSGAQISPYIDSNGEPMDGIQIQIDYKRYFV